MMRTIFRRKPSVSFCIACRNSIGQISRTLPQNLNDNRKHQGRVEFILVDFGSVDGLGVWVKDNFRQELRTGYLKYYYTDKMGSWHTCVAKNSANMLASNEIVVSLDCDNFTGPCGGDFIAKKMSKLGSDAIVVIQKSSVDRSGQAGRVALSKKNFEKLGGYNEEFEPWGHEEIDVVERGARFGLKPKKIWNPAYFGSIDKENDENPNCGAEETERDEQNLLNHDNMWRNIAAGRLVANSGKRIGVEAERVFFE